jgi:hypothetical protein
VAQKAQGTNFPDHLRFSACSTLKRMFEFRSVVIEWRVGDAAECAIAKQSSRHSGARQRHYDLGYELPTGPLG